jgi:hypothetical protein
MTLQGNTLTYFVGPPKILKQPARGVIDLTDTTIIPCDIPEKKYCFVIKHRERRDFYLQANSVDDMLTWLDLLKTATSQRQSMGFRWTLATPSCPLTWHEVKFKWHDTSFPLGIDFGMLQGGAIAVKGVHGEARAQATDIQKHEIVVALNGVSIKGWSMEQFITAIRMAAPGSNPVETGTIVRDHDTGSMPKKAVSVTIAFTFARRVPGQPPIYSTSPQKQNKPLPSLAQNKSTGASRAEKCLSFGRAEKCRSLGRGAKKMVQGIHWNVGAEKRRNLRSKRGSWGQSLMRH